MNPKTMLVTVTILASTLIPSLAAARDAQGSEDDPAADEAGLAGRKADFLDGQQTLIVKNIGVNHLALTVRDWDLYLLCPKKKRPAGGSGTGVRSVYAGCDSGRGPVETHENCRGGKEKGRPKARPRQKKLQQNIRTVLSRQTGFAARNRNRQSGSGYS